MLKIKVDDNYNLYRKHTFEFNEGLTCLIGKNGSGKSTLLKEIRDTLKQKNVFYYDNKYSEQNAKSSFGFYGEFEKLARNMVSSEGQNIRNNFEDSIYNIGQYIKKCKDKGISQAVILLDGLDSGISLDYVVLLKKDLFSLIVEDCKKDNIEPYIIISANNYEFCNNEDCVKVSDGKHFRFNNYDEFRKIYLER